VEALDGDGEGAAGMGASLAARLRLFEILLDAEMTFPRNASCCFWRYEDMVDCGLWLFVAEMVVKGCSREASQKLSLY